LIGPGGAPAGFQLNSEKRAGGRRAGPAILRNLADGPALRLLLTAGAFDEPG
jgi:hypothetical protein